MGTLAAALALALAPPPQEPVTPPSATASQARPTAAVEPAAREAWERISAATLLRPSRSAAEVTAFDLWFEVLNRGGTGSQEVDARLRWLAPSDAPEARRPAYLRFELSANAEEGRGPDGYWIREDGQPARALEGRNYVEDRRQIEELLLVVRNFVVLTNPAEVELRSLRTLSGPPPELHRGHELARRKFSDRLGWIELVSPSFQLELEDPFATARPLCRVRLGYDTDTRLPILALISDVDGRRPPLLLHLDDHRPLDDLRVPHQVRVFAFELGEEGPRPAPKPGQEMYVLKGTVRAGLTPDDFRAPR